MASDRFKLKALLLSMGLLSMGMLAAVPGVAGDAYVIHNAKIVTVDKAFSMADAVAIKDGKFIAVGKVADVLKAAGPEARKIDMGGQMVLPGFNDTHVHLTSGEQLEVQVDLTRVRSIADIKAAIGARVKASKPGDWIIGTRGWWEYKLSDGR